MSRPPFIPDEVRTRARDAYILTLGYDGQPLPETFDHALKAALGVVESWLRRSYLVGLEAVNARLTPVDEDGKPVGPTLQIGGVQLLHGAGHTAHPCATCEPQETT